MRSWSRPDSDPEVAASETSQAEDSQRAGGLSPHHKRSRPDC